MFKTLKTIGIIGLVGYGALMTWIYCKVVEGVCNLDEDLQKEYGVSVIFDPELKEKSRVFVLAKVEDDTEEETTEEVS